MSSETVAQKGKLTRKAACERVSAVRILAMVGDAATSVACCRRQRRQTNMPWLVGPCRADVVMSGPCLLFAIRLPNGGHARKKNWAELLRRNNDRVAITRVPASMLAGQQC